MIAIVTKERLQLRGERIARTLFADKWFNPETSVYCIPEVSADMMELIIQYAYTGHTEITVSNVERVLAAANYLNIQGLLHLCCDFLKLNLCSLNCISIWRTAEAYLFCELCDCAHVFILRHFEEISSTPTQEFLEMSLSELGSILEQDRLNVREEETVFKAVMTWIEHDLERRSLHIITLLPKVRLDLTSIEFCQHKVKENQLICKYKECLSLIDHALKILNKTSEKETTVSPDPASRHRVPHSVLLAIGSLEQRRQHLKIQAYDSRANSWRMISFPENPPQFNYHTAYLDGFIYIIGGYTEMNDQPIKNVLKVNPVTKTLHEVASMNSYRSDFCVVVLDEYIYALGGNEDFNILNSAERYCLLTNQWSYVAPMQKFRVVASATTLHGKIYICGGCGMAGTSSTAECFDPQSDQWTYIAPMLEPRVGSGVITLNNQIYVVGGFIPGQHRRSVEIYDPQSNTWRNVSPMLHPRSEFGIAVFDERLYVVGGTDEYGDISETEYYDERTDTWFKAQDLIFGGPGLKCCVVSDLPNITDYTAEQGPTN